MFLRSCGDGVRHYGEGCCVQELFQPLRDRLVVNGSIVTELNYGEGQRAQRRSSQRGWRVRIWLHMHVGASAETPLALAACSSHVNHACRDATGIFPLCDDVSTRT
jgi:hypothetical protein